ncbi:methyltransferase type 11 [Actinoplanes sp. ATCC 53533]|uniref:class I SAM-dependent methyltransferase n=1 Tax=Actinoplanes sp. ATCC 53533 TaxID=1288362 RepID=UPI000F7919FD|nr:class I SAM-dependent methyltransferase [Actinoplanes sp. ATCC 53533]RSM64038.1 methyltransferase type 11 [Actinoplanes sp. ATCC 53533]
MSTTVTNDEASQYAFSNAYERGSQLRLLAEILDGHTTQVLADTGIAQGWRCLDLGPGQGTITHWMAERVGPTGNVTALDLDPHNVVPADNITVRADDVRTCDLPEGHYDLIHTRLVMLHIAERDLVLTRLIAALKPGGLLVVSDWDGTRRDWMVHAPTEAAGEAFDAFQAGLLAELEAHGADLGWARRSPVAMVAAGLQDVETVVHSRLWAGGEPGCLLHLSNSHQMRDALLARGVTTEQLDRLAEAMHNPDTLAYCYWMFTSVGRRAQK